MANLHIENKQIVLTVILQNWFDDGDLKDYLEDHLSDAQCTFTMGPGGPNGSYAKYFITIDAVLESILLLTLRDFCDKNNLTHQIDLDMDFGD